MGIQRRFDFTHRSSFIPNWNPITQPASWPNRFLELRLGPPMRPESVAPQIENFIGLIRTNLHTNACTNRQRYIFQQPRSG